MALHLSRYRTELKALEYILEAIYDRIDVMSVGDTKEADSAVVFELMYTAKNFGNRCDELHQKTERTHTMVGDCYFISATFHLG